MDLFNSACADPQNAFAQELMNVFGSEKAFQILDHMLIVPLGLLVDVVSHLWKALNYELQRRQPGAKPLGLPDLMAS
jgi:hypothetical protein